MDKEPDQSAPETSQATTRNRRDFLRQVVGYGAGTLLTTIGARGLAQEATAQKSIPVAKPESASTATPMPVENIEAIGNIKMSIITEPQQALISASAGNPDLIQLSPPAKTENSDTEDLFSIKSLNKILALSALSEERDKMEQSMFLRCNNIAEVDKLLTVCVNPYTRADLLDKRWVLVQTAKESTKQKLSPEKTIWALEHGIHPATLTICMEAEQVTQKILDVILKKSKKEFRPDLAYRAETGELSSAVLEHLTGYQIMMNAGGVANLLCKETGGIRRVFLHQGKKYSVRYGLAEIGKAPVVNSFNQNSFPHTLDDLQTITDNIKSQSGLDYPIENIIGSIAAAKDASGGAIACQIMPENIKSLYNLLDTFKNEFQQAGIIINKNPFDPTWEAVLMGLFLSRGEKVDNNHNYRYGYLKGDYPILDSNGGNVKYNMGEIFRRYAIEKWNYDIKVPETISAAESYSNQFPYSH